MRGDPPPVLKLCCSMGKTSASTVSAIIKEMRSLLEDHVTSRPAAGSKGKSALKSLGVPDGSLSAVAAQVLDRHRADLDLDGAVSLMDAAAGRKVREEVLTALEILAAFRQEFTGALVLNADRWLGACEDLDVARLIGTRVAGPALVTDPTKLTTIRKWARFRNPGRRRLALATVGCLITEGRRDVASVLDICELLLNEDHPLLVTEVASILRTATKVESKAVQDFLFRRSIDGNPEILRGGSENLDAARRAALIAKLEAQAGMAPPVAATGR